MRIVVPLTLLLILVIPYLNVQGLTQALIVMRFVSFAVIGSIWPFP